MRRPISVNPQTISPVSFAACYVLNMPKGVAIMAKPKIRFERVPLEVAKKVAEKEALSRVPQDQGPKKK